LRRARRGSSSRLGGDSRSPFWRVVVVRRGGGGSRRRGRGRKEGRELVRRRDRHSTSISEGIPGNKIRRSEPD